MYFLRIRMNTSAKRALAAALVDDLVVQTAEFERHPTDPVQLVVNTAEGGAVSLDLTPVTGEATYPSATVHFANVKEMCHLISAYLAARKSTYFEVDEEAGASQISAHAATFLANVVVGAISTLTDEEATQIARWVSHLDVYTAVKSVESLLAQPSHRALFKIAAEREWDVHFDHVAIRAGSEERGDGQRVVELLCREHGYHAPAVESERSYRLSAGWNAYSLYKVLANGQLLRVFVEESATGHPTQIIQHWNRVYGFTPHHLAVRCIRWEEGGRVAVPLAEVIAAMAAHGNRCLTPTGHYTQGLLEQVCTEPIHLTTLPDDERRRLAALGEGLETAINNGPLLELVSRREMAPELAAHLFPLRGLAYRPTDPLHSAPIYPYFLQTQTAHVFATSVET